MEQRTERIILDKRFNFSTFITIKPTDAVVKPGRDATEKPIEINLKPAKEKTPPRTVRKQTRKRSSKDADKLVQRRLTELDLHYDNIKTVLRCSNATPIRGKSGEKYSCSYCSDLFDDPQALKTHTLNNHSPTDDKPECLTVRSLSKYCVHLDVTDLKCEICDSVMDKLETLIDHLKTEHDELIHTNIRNLLVPYKFEDPEIKCVVCVKQFEDFDKLKDHMSEHYKNYVCEFCDKAFLLRSAMIDHKKVVHRV